MGIGIDDALDIGKKVVGSQTGSEAITDILGKGGDLLDSNGAPIPGSGPAGGRGGGGSATTVSPNIQTQVSPQISPVFQQSQGGGSQTASTSMISPGGQTGQGGGSYLPKLKPGAGGLPEGIPSFGPAPLSTPVYKPADWQPKPLIVQQGGMAPWQRYTLLGVAGLLAAAVAKSAMDRRKARRV